MTGIEPAIPLTPRTPPEKLRWLADYLASGAPSGPAELTLRTMAAELAEDGWDAARDRVTEANEARRDERERCAQLAEQHMASYLDFGTDLDPIQTRRTFADLLRKEATDAA